MKSTKEKKTDESEGNDGSTSEILDLEGWENFLADDRDEMLL